MIFVAIVFVALFMQIDACGPTGGLLLRGRSVRKKMTPLVLKESHPSTSEFSLAASGPSSGIVAQGSEKFKELVLNYSPDIIFADEEGSGEDHLMSRSCKERANRLAISVLNQFPGVKLKILEAYDLDMVHDVNSLHYSGRAIDVTTSDRDRTKLGTLARLAVEAGFSYVKYSAKTYVHCSVKIESSDVRRAGGCFSANGIVETPNGIKRMDELEIGDTVLTLTSLGVAYSPVIAFLDRDNIKRYHVKIKTDSGRILSLTPSHLLYTAINDTTNISGSVPKFASEVVKGNFLYIVSSDKDKVRTITLEKVINVTRTIEEEHYAPLTEAGTIIVNDVICSCFAMIKSHEFSYNAFAPLRLFYNFENGLKHFLKTFHFNFFEKTQVAPTAKRTKEKFHKMHFYAEKLLRLSYMFLPEDLLYQ